MYKTRLMTVRPSQTIDHVQSRPSLQAEWAHLSPQGHHDLAWPRLQRVVVRMCEEEMRNSKKGPQKAQYVKHHQKHRHH